MFLEHLSVLGRLFSSVVPRESSAACMALIQTILSLRARGSPLCNIPVPGFGTVEIWESLRLRPECSLISSVSNWKTYLRSVDVFTRILLQPNNTPTLPQRVRPLRV